MKTTSRSATYRRLLAGLVVTAVPTIAACDGDLFNDTSWVYNVCPVDAGPSEASCVLDAAPGIFVRGGGDDAASGTRNAPVATLRHAIELASASGGPKRVYACAEEFQEVVELDSGIELYGGLACDEGWAWTPQKATRIAPTSAQSAALVLKKGSGSTRVEDLEIVAPAGVEPGASSIAVLAAETAATLTRCTLSASNGAPGAPGVVEGGPKAAENGEENGGDGCAAGGQPTPGADQVEVRCDGGDVTIGGAGGSSPPGDGAGNPGEPGLPRGAGGTAGEGEPAGASAWSCDTVGKGANGESGTPGPNGAGAQGVGTPSATGFVGAAGSPGAHGKAGQGGGGGGASSGKGCVANAPGAGGGGGATGGCGGLPGVGGGGGGSSIALLSVDARVTLRLSKLSAAAGGDGGDGALGTTGAAGGEGGDGGNEADAAAAGCKGGNGGQGGDGGPGGGGRGGHSIAIGFTGTPPVVEGGAPPEFVEEPAPGGNPGDGTRAGLAGLNSAVLDFAAE